jgi:hypothetical protein
MSVGKASRGRPIVHSEPWSKITVVLLNRHIVFLDRLAVDIRLEHGKAISRAELLRALVEAAIQSGMDLTEADSAEALVALINRERPKRRLSP